MHILNKCLCIKSKDLNIAAEIKDVIKLNKIKKKANKMLMYHIIFYWYIGKHFHTHQRLPTVIIPKQALLGLEFAMGGTQEDHSKIRSDPACLDASAF